MDSATIEFSDAFTEKERRDIEQKIGELDFVKVDPNILENGNSVTVINSSED